MASINPFQPPMNYAIDVQSPFEAALGGFKLGAAGAEVQAKQAEAQAKETARKNAMDAQAKVQALLADKNATASDLTQASFLLPKDQADNILKIAGEMTTVQNQNTLSQAGQVYSALKAGQPEIAAQLLQDQIDAHRNSGNEPKAKATETYLKLIGINPTGAQNTIGIMMAMMPGGKEILENVDRTLSTGRLEAQAPAKLREAEAAAAKAEEDALAAGVVAEFARPLAAFKLSKDKSDALLAASNAKFADQLNQSKITTENWNVKNLQSQINDRVAKLKLDQATTQANVNLTLAKIADLAVAIPDAAKVEINKAAIAASTSKQQAEQFNSLSNRINDIGTSWGSLGSFNEWLKKSTGSQGAVSELRQEFTRLRNTAAVQSLPPGPATDKDIQMVLSGFPSDTSDPKVISSFLRGMAKMQDLDASVQSAKVDWMSQNKGSLGRAPSAFIAGDLSAKAGETFADFTVRVSSEIAKRYQNPQAQIPTGTPAEVAAANRGQIPVAGQPAAAPTTSIRSQADAIIRGGS